MKTMEQLFREVILWNEVSGNQNAILRFSDPDGPSGRSGWSFGLCQFDTRHNDAAVACLKELGFTPAEVNLVRDQAGNVKPLEAKLKAGAAIIERYDTAQLARCLHSALNTTTSNGILAVDTGGILCLADYVNQYGSIGPSFVKYLNEHDLDKDITPAEVQAWKLTTAYGQKHKGDCERRYNNILKVLRENAL